MTTGAHLEITARPAPELLERVARVLRHRGATVERLDYETGTMTVVRAQIRCISPVDLVVRQLERLPDVHSVRAFNTLAASGAVAVPSSTSRTTNITDGEDHDARERAGDQQEWSRQETE